MLTLLLSFAFAQEPAPDTQVPDAEVPADTDAPVAEPEPAGPQPDPLLGRVYTPTRDWQVRPDSPYWDIEVLIAKTQYKEAAELAQKRFDAKPDPQLAAYITRGWFEYIEEQEDLDKKQRMALYEKALANVELVMETDPGHPRLQFAYAILLARMGTTRGVLASLRYADDIESAWINVIDSEYRYADIELQEEVPCDIYLALGIFYRLVPDSWIVKAIAGTKGDLDKSLDMLEKGAKCSGPRIRNLKELGATQLCIGTTNKDPAMIEKGKQSINTYMAIEPKNKRELIDIKHGIALLKDHSLACGYSRDGQQERDEAKIEK